MNLENKKIETYILNNHKNRKLFCLVDGAQIDHSTVPNIQHTFGGCLYLFKETFEEEAYQYGPIMFDLSQSNQEQLENLFHLMRNKDSMIFIESGLDIKSLKNKLLEKLYVELEDGGIGILRYYDPRVLKRLSQIITDEQRTQFMDGFDTLYFMLHQTNYELKNEA
ncbi:DUF4123 domain-containing protein [Acinetobacter haemolyticus]|uniref:DUF4123 domain-containing protein n=1 Tax=Acinetobacter haemolyticus TaxID=29430 RepID=A0A4P7B7S8_ACIHA|nr:DUF4123 domain-containing protein [Acinetobacter haemolyticus]QBQ17123.1 DUF4123 domain-containing protein [Acinetobacter haemolyticus]